MDTPESCAEFNLRATVARYWRLLEHIAELAESWLACKTQFDALEERPPVGVFPGCHMGSPPLSAKSVPVARAVY